MLTKAARKNIEFKDARRRNARALEVVLHCEHLAEEVAKIAHVAEKFGALLAVDAEVDGIDRRGSTGVHGHFEGGWYLVVPHPQPELEEGWRELKAGAQRNTPSMGNKKKRKGPPQPEPSGRETMRRMHAEDARADRLAAESKQASYRSLEPPTRFELDDDPSRDGVSFGLVMKQQQRIRERQRRDMLREDRRQQEKREREERRLRELDEEVDREVDVDLRRRIREGDLRERVVSEVLARLKTPEVEAQIEQRSEAAIAARRKELRDGLEAERVARVAAARRAEEQRLEEAARLESILAENAERAAAEQRKRAEEIGQQRKERELELAMLHRARAKPNS